MSLVHVACQNGCLDVLKWLVWKLTFFKKKKKKLNFFELKVESQTFDIDEKDASGATGLHYCCSNGHPSLVFYLLSRNARIQVDNFGKISNIL